MVAGILAILTSTINGDFSIGGMLNHIEFELRRLKGKLSSMDKAFSSIPIKEPTRTIEF